MRRINPVQIKGPLIILVLAFLLSFLSFHVQADNAASGDALPNGGLNPVYSPDGRKIAFISGTMHTQTDIWIMDHEAGNFRRLTFSGAHNASWSQDSKYIFFQKRHAGYGVYWTVNVEGAPVVEKFLTLPENSIGMTPSPDSSKIAYLTRSGDFIDLYIMNPDGSDIKGLTENFGIRSYQWDADGRNIFFEVGIEFGVGIFSVDTESLELKHVYNGYVGKPVYSKEANKIAFAVPAGGKKYQIKVVNTDGTDLKTFDTPHSGSMDISWSGKGDSILYAGPDEKGENALWGLDASSGKETRTTPRGYEVNSYTFSPDGNTLIFSGATGASYNMDMWRLRDLDKAPKGFWGKVASFFGIGPKPEGLIKSGPSHWAPVASPGGEYVAYISNLDRKGTVEIVNMESGKKTTINNLVLDNNSRIVWLAEPEHLAVYNKQSIQIFNFKGETAPLFYKEIFYVDANLRENKLLVNAVKSYIERPRIYLIDYEGVTAKKETMLVPENERYSNPPADMQPKWSFKGDAILFVRENAVWKMTPEGSNRERLTDFKAEGEGMQPVVSDPAWSVRDDKITFAVSKKIDADLLWEIWVMDKDGSGAGRLASHVIDNDFYLYASDFTYQPFFSAAGDAILYTAVSGGLPNIHEISLAGGQPGALTIRGGIFPSLFPDDGLIIYVSTAGNTEKLHIMNTDGTEDRQF